MRIEIYFASSENGASAKSFFKSPFEWSAIPTMGTKTAVKVESNRGNLVLKGVLMDVLMVKETLGKALFGTEMSREDLREIILPGELRLQEVYNWLD